MTDLREIPPAELKADYSKSVAEIQICEIALNQGVNHYSGDKSVAYRLKTNQQIAAKIRAELDRRALT